MRAEDCCLEWDSAPWLTSTLQGTNVGLQPLSWPLVGRTDELDLIDRRRAAGDRAVILAGDAGVGKSRLAREAIVRFEQRGAVTRWVQATSSAATVPLGAFAGLLPESIRADDPLELMRLGVRALRDLGKSGQVVLGVDDAHLLDPGSAALLLELTVSSPAFVVMTIRTGAACPDAVISVWKDQRAARLELGALDRAQTELLAEEIVGGPIEHAARAWVYDTSLGNALYACELIRGAMAGGALAEAHGLWRMSSRPAISASLTELISARLAGLPPPSIRALELLALAEALPVTEFASLVSSSVVADVEARGLVSVTAGARPEVSLTHPLFGEVVRDGLPAFHRRQLQTELAAAIGQRAVVPALDLLRITRWLVEAEQEIPTETLLDAAATANLSGDPDFGALLARRAAGAGAGPKAALLLARALVLQGSYLDAAEVLRAIEEQVAGDFSSERALVYLELQTTVLYWGLRRANELGRLLDRARCWNTSREWQQHIDRLRLVGHDHTPPGAVVEASEKVYDSPNADPDVRRRLAPFLAANLFYSGRVRDAYVLLQATRPSVPLQDLTDEITLALLVAVTLEHGERWEELSTWASAAIKDGIRLADHAAVGRAALALGGLRFSQGRFSDAGRLLAEAELQLDGRDAGGLLGIVNAMQVGVACFTGNIDAIDPALEQCLSATGSDDPLPSQLPYVARAKAWAVLGHGDPQRAQALLLDAAHELTEMPVYAARLTYEALRAGAPARRLAPRLQDLAGRCDARLTAAYAAHATARAAADADALLAAADEMEAIGALRYSAEASAHAASVHALAGRDKAARHAASRCEDLLSRGSGGNPPVIEGLETGLITLTARERQLVDLAARGLTNTQIADLLVLSVRTVESHLYRAMTKLGVTSRRQLS